MGGKWFLISSMALLCLSTITYANGIAQDLGGNDWNVSTTSKELFDTQIPANVPGSIYSDLRNAGFIKDDIYNNFNDIQYRWVSYVDWIFEKIFNVEPGLLNHDNVYLTCHGLDTVGQVYLNGHLLGSVDNMFVRYKWSVRNILKPVGNLITVSFVSAPRYAKEYYMNVLNKSYEIPPVCVPKDQHGECHVNFIRKMQSSFSWDWGPAFPTQGIWKPIVLEAYNTVLLRSITVKTFEDHSGHWFLNATIWMEGKPSTKVDGSLLLNLDRNSLSNHKIDVHLDSTGEGFKNVFIMIPDQFKVKPWFPNGLGQQTLYDLKASLIIGQEVTSKLVKIGFRTIELVQDKLASSREAYSFYFKVNGVPIYSKGSNWIPAHVLQEAIEKDYVRDLLLYAKMANMNMLRVWGGGIYESDYFYDLADQFGILIWQDMMFACALYPTDPNFLSSVSTEIKQQVRRLQHHPSIAVWAGNNENEQAISGMWWPEIFLKLADYKRDYLKLYIYTIMPIVLQEDDTRPFLSSSPSNGIFSYKENFISSNPQSNQFGDVHHYIQFGDAWNWTRYPSAKFVSEYGFQSLPSLATLEKYLNSQYLKYPFNQGLIHREHQQNGLGYLTAFMQVNLPMPKSNSSTEMLDDFIYLSQIFQSMAIKIETEFYRRNRHINDNGEGFTMGALYWQLNNIWPGFSWSSVEYGGKWKMLHYYVQRMFDNLIVDVFEDDGLLKAVIVRDDHVPRNVEFDVVIEVFDWSRTEPILNKTVHSITEPFSVKLAFREDMNTFLQNSTCTDRNKCFIQVSIYSLLNSKLVTRNNFLLLAPIKNALGMQKPNIRVKSITGPVQNEYGMDTFTIELQTDRIAPFVYLDFESGTNITGFFSDNGFMMTKDTVVWFHTNEKISKIKLNNSLKIKSLKDVNE